VRSRSSWSGPLAVVLAAASLAAAAGCGGGGAGGPAPIRIGSLLPLSGYGLSYYASAFSAAVRSINARGGVKGRPLQMDVCDDHSDPNQAQACARKLVGDGVIATAADVSELSMVEGPILDEAGIAQVGGEAVNTEDFTLPTAFPLDGGIFIQAAGGIIGARRRGLHSLFAVTIDTPAGRTLVGSVDQVAKAAGIEPAGAAYIPEAATDVLAYVQAAIQSRADIVFPGLPPSATIPFLVDSRVAGAKYLVMLPAGEFTQADIELMGGPQAVTENDIEFAALPPISAADRFPALKTFAADMDAERAAGDRNAAPEFRTGGSVSAWLCVQIIARLAASLPVIDAAGILRALRTSPTVDTLGLTPPWAPGRTGPPTMPRVTNAFGYLSSQRDGVEVLTDPTPLNPLLALRLGG
jgi:branched-chain amino acid transport system substrate-binding protein